MNFSHPFNSSVLQILPEAYLLKYESEADLIKALFEENENNENEFEPLGAGKIRTARNTQPYDRRDNGRYSDNNTAASPTANGHGIKAKLKYHQEQRHPNGSISGSYGQSEPDGRLKIIHYIKDDKGYYKEFPETVNNLQAAKNGVGAVGQQTTKSTSPNDGSVHLNNRRGVYYAPLEGQEQSPILQSAIGSVKTYMEKSPLHDKYYRPTPQEVQQAYEYHRLRSIQNPDAFRPRDATPLPDLPPLGKQPEIKGVYGEYRSPVTNIRYTQRTPGVDYYSYSSTPPVNDVRYYNNAPPAVTVSSAIPAYAPTPSQPIYSPSPGPDLQIYSSQPSPPPPSPELVNPTPQFNPSIEQQQQYAGGPQSELYPQLYYPTYYAPYGGLYIQNPYPQTLPVQNPVYVQTDANQPFALGSTYSGPQSPNTATFNQPYPSNVPIYQQQPVPQNIPTFVQAPPGNVPIYQQTPAAQLSGNTAIPPGLPPEALAYAGVNPNNLVVNAVG